METSTQEEAGESAHHRHTKKDINMTVVLISILLKQLLEKLNCQTTAYQEILKLIGNTNKTQNHTPTTIFLRLST